VLNPARVALNPLPWFLQGTSWLLNETTLRSAAPVVASAGFGAIQLDLPQGMTPAEYSAVLTEYGLRPAPGYFAAAFQDATERRAQVEAARTHARAHRELGLDCTFIASAMSPERLDAPTVGAAADPDRLNRIIDGIRDVAAAITAEGVTPALHQHVASWIETPEELEAVLAGVDPELLSFGPDTGHLFWAGANPAATMVRHANRIAAVHLKDVHADRAAQARRDGADYWVSTNERHTWAEPGRGDVDFDAVFASLPQSFDGWFVLEVDVPDLESPEASTRYSAEWIRRHYRRAESRS
jgi:inosose dehydratase